MPAFLNPKAVALIEQNEGMLAIHLSSGCVLILTNTNAEIQKFRDILLICSAENPAPLVEIPKMITSRLMSPEEYLAEFRKA